ncbi:glycosyl hydrolase family 61-domain-containing protein [Cristinia sonorae]|uniref:lytic cellulose monooxygenase (C4-dehydrogenating) n=1 Tax=Cristinia sonorae TaxID=1940300 RepID=A0A8K0UYD6_9AGAR|nr:glycosyl hydrolase family 61-domain-containing protein [Cristinia sonorae]
MIAAFLPLLAVALSVVDSVNAHGYVQDVTVGGKQYPGWLPFEDPYKTPQPDTVVRHVPSDGPIFSVQDPGLACNTGGEKGTKAIADAPAGGPITFHWNQWLADHLGPVSTYMASCNGDCTSFNTANAKWFKIDAAGYDSGKKQWASQQLINNGNKWTSTIPASLADGQYLVRHEVIALHSAGAPQFYPSCTQVKVTGGGNAKAPAAELVSIPGIYDGVQFPNIWLDSFNSFTIPGPALFAGGSGSGNGNNNSQAPPPPPPVNNAGSAPPANTPATATPAPSATSSSVAPSATDSSSGRCRHNARRSDRMLKRHVAFHKRHHH